MILSRVVHFNIVLVFDLWGKVESGYLEGNQFNFGHFTECLSFKHEAPAGSENIQGQYCLIAFDGLSSSITADAPSNGFDWREM